MQRGIAWSLVAPLIALGLVGCRFFDYEAREPWRAEAEEQCLAQRLVQPSEFLEPGGAVNGKGTCGMTKPFKVAAVSGGFVEFKPKATLSCPLVANIEAWFHEAIQPAAMAWYGSPVTEIKQISAYSCRTMNGQPYPPPRRLDDDRSRRVDHGGVRRTQFSPSWPASPPASRTAAPGGGRRGWRSPSFRGSGWCAVPSPALPLALAARALADVEVLQQHRDSGIPGSPGR
jgi:hypothetical protein